MNEYSPAGHQESGGSTSETGLEVRSDPLTELEDRWEKLAKMVQELRSENAALWEQVRGRDDQTGRLERELAARSAELAALHEEKRQMDGRISGLLARFDAVGQ